MISRIQSHFRTAHPRLSARTTSSYTAANDNTSVLVLCVHNILYGYLDPSAVCVFRAGKICVHGFYVCDKELWVLWLWELRNLMGFFGKERLGYGDINGTEQVFVYWCWVETTKSIRTREQHVHENHSCHSHCALGSHAVTKANEGMSHHLMCAVSLCVRVRARACVSVCACVYAVSVSVCKLNHYGTRATPQLTSLFCPDLYKCGLFMSSSARTSLSRIADTTGGAAVNKRLKKMREISSIALEPENPLYSWNQ